VEKHSPDEASIVKGQRLGNLKSLMYLELNRQLVVMEWFLTHRKSQNIIAEGKGELG
jgi:hypothetical protein